MEQLFTVLTQAVTGTPLVAVAASFAWGILSVLLSPCHLSSIPLVIGFVNDQSGRSTKRAFLLSLLFSLGVLITIALIGFVTALLGRMLGDVGKWSSYVVGGVFILVGLHLLGVLPLSFLSGGSPNVQKRGALAAFILGLIFGFALGPCTFAYMAPIMGVVFSLASSKLMFCVTLLCAYALGHCAVIVIAGTSSQLVSRLLKWNETSKALDILKKACGVLVILGGAYFFYSAP